MHGFAYLTTSLCNMVHNIMSQIAAKKFYIKERRTLHKEMPNIYLHIRNHSRLLRLNRSMRFSSLEIFSNERKT